MYKYILFDWDGTLIKTLDPWLDVYKILLKNRNIAVPSDKEIVDKSFGKWGPGLANLGIKDSEEAYTEAKELVDKAYSKSKLYSGARELLVNLKKSNKKITLLTSSMRDKVLNAVRINKLEEYFDVIITRDDVVNGKPDPEIFLKGIEKLNGNKEEAIIIGDSYHDILGGKNAGIATVAFYPKENEKFYKREELEKEKPDYFVTNLKELLKIIL